MTFYFMGIDGSGKSSILYEIEKYLATTGVETETIWARYTPSLTKSVIGYFKKKTINHRGNYNELTSEEYSLWKSSKSRISGNHFVKKILLNVFFLDYSIQIRKVLRSIKSNRGKIILLDRFVIDFIVDQTINLGDLSKTKIYKKLIRIADGFDAVFFISVKPEIALGRKSDIPGYEYLYERSAIYSNVMDKLGKGYIIDNNGALDVAVNHVIEIIKHKI